MVAITGAASLPSSHSPIRRSSSVPGTSPAVSTWPSNSSATPVAFSGCSSDCGWSNNALRQLPSRGIASMSRCSSRRTAMSAWPRAKLASAAIRVPTASANSSHTVRVSNGTTRGT